MAVLGGSRYVLGAVLGAAIVTVLSFEIALGADQNRQDVLQLVLEAAKACTAVAGREGVSGTTFRDLRRRRHRFTRQRRVANHGD